jgi:hypothetical protein
MGYVPVAILLVHAPPPVTGAPDWRPQDQKRSVTWLSFPSMRGPRLRNPKTAVGHCFHTLILQWYPSHGIGDEHGRGRWEIKWNWINIWAVAMQSWSAWRWRSEYGWGIQFSYWRARYALYITKCLLEWKTIGKQREVAIVSWPFYHSKSHRSRHIRSFPSWNHSRCQPSTFESLQIIYREKTESDATVPEAFVTMSFAFYR